MCGVVGTYNWGDREELEAMNRAQFHRGPDDGGTWSTRIADGTFVGLGSRRLSILDLSSAGHMPMRTPDDSHVLVYNGEIYNFKKLRQQLVGEGIRFRSRGDTEVVLWMYAKYGPRCVERFRGMFAFAIWDAPNERLFLARDHFGIKPLYYTTRRNRFAFASEFKSFLHLPGFEARLDFQSLQRYLSLLWVPDPYTMLEDVYKLPAGHRAYVDRSGFRLEQYWDLTFPEPYRASGESERDLADELRERFTRSVREQMIADVPMGAFLSSGLDSNSIVSTMAHVADEPVRTFTITFPEKRRRGEIHLDDPSVSREAASAYGCLHREIVVEPDVVDLLPRLVYQMDEPTSDPAIVMAYLVCREASTDVKVLLSGIGGDELFAGYRKYRAHQLAKGYRLIPEAVRTHVIKPAVAALPSFRGTPLKGYVRLAKKMVRSAGLPDEERFMMDSVYLDAAGRRWLCTDEAWTAGKGVDPLGQHRAAFGRVEGADFLNRMLYLDTKLFMVSLNLTYNDKMSMANSVEVRVPFLDHEFAQWVADHVPPNLKLGGGIGKLILRRAFGGRIPDRALRQRKAGFGAPIDHWLVHDLKEMMDDTLAPDVVRKRGIFRTEAVAQLVKDHRGGADDHSFQIWQLLTLELWLRQFVDRST